MTLEEMCQLMTLEDMWQRLERHQPFADRRGYGEAWAKMCRERTQDTAAAAAKVAWTVRPAAPEAAKAALWSVPPAASPGATLLPSTKWQAAIYWIEKSEGNKKITDKTLIETLDELRPAFQEAMAKEEKESEDFWQSLTKDQQLQAFCAVMRRLYKGEIEENRTYRGMLYDVFGFGPESYAAAQMSGFLTIHNCIWTSEEIEKEIEKRS